MVMKVVRAPNAAVRCDKIVGIFITTWKVLIKVLRNILGNVGFDLGYRRENKISIVISKRKLSNTVVSHEEGFRRYFGRWDFGITLSESPFSL